MRPNTTVTWGAFNTVATYGKHEGTSADLSSSILQFGLPIDVPAGPGDTLPRLALAYNSATISEQHNPQRRAGQAKAGI